MKMTLTMMAGACAVVACGAAQAQSSSVSVYGVADVFAEYGRAGTVAAPVSVKRVQSGGANGSRLGFRGTEDLGGGLQAGFIIEHGLLLDTGNPASGSAFWNRQSLVSLGGAWGTVSGGRQYSPLLVHQDTFDPAFCTTGYGSAYNSGVMRTVSRVNNSVLYRSPKWGGVSGSLMIGLGETTSGLRAGSTLSGSAKYADGPLAAGFAFAKLYKPDATKEDKSIWNIAGSWQLGDFLLMGAVQGTSNDSQALNTPDDRSELMLGGVYTNGPHEVRASYGQGKVKGVADSTARHYSLGYLYNLSKRTAVFAVAQSVDNPGNLAYRTSGFTFDAIDGGLPAGAGVNARALAVGLRTRF